MGAVSLKKKKKKKKIEEVIARKEKEVAARSRIWRESTCSGVWGEIQEEEWIMERQRETDM